MFSFKKIREITRGYYEIPVGLTNSGRMTPECIIGLVINLGVGMGEELASDEVAFEAMMTCCCCWPAAVMGTNTLFEAVVLLKETRRLAASILAASCSLLEVTAGAKAKGLPPLRLKCREQ